MSLTASTGLPESSETTWQSCQSIPVGTPSALAAASFTANLAANDAGPRGSPEAVTCSAGVNSRRANVGVRSSAAANLSTATTSMPTAITLAAAGYLGHVHAIDLAVGPGICAYSTVTDLARLRGLSMS